MNEVKTIMVKGYTLTHSWYVDPFGQKRNSFDLFDEETRTHHPFHGNLRVSNQSKSDGYLGDDTSPYTDEEYLEMLNEQISKIQNV